MRRKRNLVISGSSKGIGLEISRILNNEEFNIITMGFKTSGNVDFYADLSNFIEAEQIMREIHSTHGEISILVCNAGTGKKPENIIDDTDLKEFFFRTNFLTAKNLIEASIPYMQRPRSTVIGISSIAALMRIEGAPQGYAESKLALNQYFKEKSRTLAELGIRLNLISPGNVYFDGSRWEQISGNSPELVRDLLEKQVPLKSFISPNEIAQAIDFLSSESARNITGANLVIDGGQSA